MPTCTPLYGFPIPAGSDSPCTLGDTLCAFHTAVDTKLDSFDDIITRTATSVPLVEIGIGAPISFVTQALTAPAVPVFDTIILDTANMADLSVNSAGFTTPTAALYYFWFSLRGTITVSGGGTNLDVSMNTIPSLGFPGDLLGNSNFGPVARTQGTTTGKAGISGGMFNVSTAGMIFILSVGINGTVGDTIVCDDLRMGACYVADLP